MEINMEAFLELLKERFDNNQAKMARILGGDKSAQNNNNI